MVFWLHLINFIFSLFIIIKARTPNSTLLALYVMTVIFTSLMGFVNAINLLR